ncbi:MAG TPA: PilN domain-containing protein [Acidobacteriota bacterium]|nr:PilN domain-containing protein [Acidobacteriota bacterium]
MFNLDSALGVEIQADRLILASIKRGLNDRTLQNHLVIEGFRDLPDAQLISQVRQFTKTNGFNRENVVVGLPRDHVIIREIEFPMEVEENLERVIQFQVEKLEPSEEESSYHDFRIMERDEEARRIVVQVAMVRQAYLDDYLKLFRELDLFPASVTNSGQGYLGLVASGGTGLGGNESSLVFRLESGMAEIIALGGETKFSSQTIPLGEEDVTVEEILRKADPFISGLEGHIESFSKVYLTGELARGLYDDFATLLGADVELLAKNLELKRKAISGRELDELLPAAGLAISRFGRKGRMGLNLVPVGERVVTSRASFIPSLVLSCMLFILLAALGTREYFQTVKLGNQIDGEVQGLQNQVDEAFRLRDLVAALRAELEELGSLMEGRQQSLMILRDLTERIPEDSYLQNVQLQGQQLTMQGYSDEASRLPPVLLESDYLENVKTNWITTDPRNPGKERFSFAATLKQ